MYVLYKSMFLISSNCSAIYLSIENKLISFRELKKEKLGKHQNVVID